jgi:hypothetical protein
MKRPLAPKAPRSPSALLSLFLLPFHPHLRAQLGERAFIAPWFPRLADSAAVVDQSVRKIDPFVAWQERHQIVLDFDRIGVLCETQTLAYAADVGVDDHSRSDAKGRAEHNVGRLAAGSRQLDELLELAGNFAAVLLDKQSAARLNILGLIAKEAGGLDDLFQFLDGQFGELFGGRVAGEEIGSDDIHSGVGALRRKDSGDQELKWSVVAKGAFGFGIGFAQRIGDSQRRGRAGLGEALPAFSGPPTV